jgi:Zn finger protein HypA/HybF involved in hydrogenase expression
MHEFAAVQYVITEARKIQPTPKKILVRLGKMRGGSKGFEEMFREHSRGTPLENIGLEIESIPVEVKCPCGFSGTMRVIEHVHFLRCPVCGKIADVLKGNELTVESLE